MNRIAGKRILITGASAGIGEACAKAFAESGANLLLSARRIERVEKLAGHLSEKHDIQVHAAKLDVTDSSAVASYVDELADENLVPDILINNAGKAVGLDLLHEGLLDDWEDMIDTNIKGFLYVSRAVIPLMVARNSGHVINIGSIAGRWVSSASTECWPTRRRFKCVLIVNATAPGGCSGVRVAPLASVF